MTRKILSVLLILTLFCTMIPMTVFTAAAEETIEEAEPVDELPIAEEPEAEPAEEPEAEPAEEPAEEAAEAEAEEEAEPVEETAEAEAEEDVDEMDIYVWYPMPNFTDVKSSAWYYNAVRWAVSNRITLGTTGSTFSPDKVCTRAEVVEFLWNAAGRPTVQEPDTFFVQSIMFKDVYYTDWYYRAVKWAVVNGIAKGTDATHFSPNQPCTRAEIVTFIWNACGRGAYAYNNPFTDVSKSAWYYKPVMWACRRGITSGTTKTTFSPNKSCTRAEVVQFLYKARWYMPIPEPQYP